MRRTDIALMATAGLATPAYAASSAINPDGAPAAAEFSLVAWFVDLFNGDRRSWQLEPDG